MSNEVEDEDEIPEGDGPYDKGLWAQARHWVGWLTTVYDAREIALVGLSRRLALRCKNWLWSIEGMVRRLILAAALALDPKSLPARVRARTKTKDPPQPKAQAEPSEPPQPSAAFRVFAVHRKPGARNPPRVLSLDEWVAMGPKVKRQPPPPPPEHRHLPFPADDLLAIGAAEARRPRQGPLAKHRPHPLDRRGRASRWDPDYKSDPEKEAESDRRYMFGPFPVLPDRFSRPPRERKHRDIHDPYYRGIDDDWRRIEEEWRRVIPAPDLAGRIMALVRVMAKPDRWIERIARQLHRNARLAALLKAVPAPRLEKPKRDRTPGPPGLTCLDLSHAAIVAPDTS